MEKIELTKDIFLCESGEVNGTQIFNWNGYQAIVINEERFLVHRLVAQYFLNHGNELGKLVVHHKDGNRLNNDKENLEIMSRQKHTAIHRKEETPETLYNAREKAKEFEEKAREYHKKLMNANGVIQELQSQIDILNIELNKYKESPIQELFDDIEKLKYKINKIKDKKKLEKLENKPNYKKWIAYKKGEIKLDTKSNEYMRLYMFAKRYDLL